MGIWQITEAHLERAARVVAAHARRTAVEAAPALGPGVWLAREDAQETGSFKLRGALAALAALDEGSRARGVITASAGNHGYGLAHAGRRLGVPVTVFVASSAPAVKREGIAAAGAHLEPVDAEGYDAVEEAARAAAERRGVPFVSPFDDPDVAAGNGGTLGLTILEERPDVRTLVAPVGGGGLIAGLAAARRIRGATFRLVGVQSEACPAMVRSLAAGRPLLKHAATGPTLAEGLEGGVGETTFAIARDELWRMDAVPEEDIAAAMVFAHEELGLTLEGSAAVTLAWLRRHGAEAPRPLVLVCSGRNVDRRVLERLRATG
jgi:threonine dehydratase